MAIDWTKAAQITQSAKQYNGTTLPATTGSAGGINWEAAAKITGQKWNPSASPAGTSSLNELFGFTRSAPSASTAGRITATPPEGATARMAGATKKAEEEETGRAGQLLAGTAKLHGGDILWGIGKAANALGLGGEALAEYGKRLSAEGEAQRNEAGRTRAGQVISGAVQGWLGSGLLGISKGAEAIGLAGGENAINQSPFDRLREQGNYLKAQGQRDTDGAKEGLGKGGQTAVDIGTGVVQLAADAATGPASLVMLANRVFGDAVQEAQDNGAEGWQAYAYGAAKGAAEVLIEKLAGNLGKIYGASFGDDITEAIVKRAAQTDAGRTALRIFLGALGEGGEEAASTFLDPVLKAIYDKGDAARDSYTSWEGFKETAADAGYDALIGAAVGAIGDVATNGISGENARKNAALREQEQTQQTTPAAPQNAVQSDSTGQTGAETPAQQSAPQQTGPQYGMGVNNQSAADLFAPQQNTQTTEQQTAEQQTTGGRTVPTQSAFAEQALEGTPLEGRTTHEVHSDAQVNAEADARMQDREGEAVRLFGDDHQTWGDTDTEVAKRLISEAITKAKETGDWTEVARLRRVYDAEGTKAGQEMRQRRTFKNTPEDIVSAAADILYGKNKAGIDNARQMTDAEKADVMKNVEQFANDAANIPEGDTAAVIEQIKRLNEARHTTGVFRTNTSRTVSNMLEKVARMEGGDAFLRNLLSAQIQGYANDYKAPSRINQVKTFRVMNLLSKLSTVARNFVSNTVFDPVETLSNNISTPLDALLSKITGTRSVAFDRSWASKAKRQGSAEGFIKSYLQVAMDAEFDGETGKYEDSGARVFKMGGGANLMERLMSQWQMYENVLLKSTDEFAKGGARAEAQRGVDLLVERGLASQEGLADTASNIAKERTLQEESKLSSVMKKGRDALNTFAITDSRGGALGAGDMLLPFAQVPANVGLMNVRMNPFAGGAIAVKNLVQTLKAAQNGTLTAEQQRRAVMSVGRALTGTALATIGAVLSAKGIIRVAGSDDKDKAAIEKAERQNGMQINLSAAERVLNGGSGEWQDGDALMSIGFLEQIAGPLMLGNALYDAYKDDGSLGVDEIGKASLSSLAESMMELPAISQISGLVQDYQYSSADTTGGKLADAAVGFAGNAAASFLVPNAVRGIAQGMDNTVRDTYSSGTTLGNAWDYIRAGVPGLRETLPSSVDSWGQERNYTDSDVLNALNANILPGAVTQYNTNDVNQELARLYEAGYDKVYPDRPAGKATVNDEQLGAEALRQYNIDKGTTAYDLFADMLATSTYQNMTDEDKAKAIDVLYDYAKAAANGKAGSNKDAEKWVVTAYNAQRNGGDAVGYMAMKAAYNATTAGAYLNLTDAGVDSDTATAIVSMVERRGGPDQENVYKVIRELGLNDAGAEALWEAYAKQKGWTTSWEDFVKKQEK